MAYNIQLLRDHSISDQLYLFDSNLWIKILKPPGELGERDQKYLEFFQRFQKSSHRPKVALTSLILSEVINRLLREVSMKLFIQLERINKDDIKNDFYKLKYRNNNHFKKQYEILCDDIAAYQDLYILVGDGLGDLIKTEDLLKTPPSGLDFNDHYYYLLAKRMNIPIVTDDGDFFVEDVKILTYNNNLYQRGKNSIKPKI